MAARLSESDMEALSALGVEREAPLGQLLVREGATAGSLFLILSGRVAISRGGRRLTELGAGDVLGELGVVCGGPRSASAVVEQAGRVLVVPATAVRRLAADRPTLGEALERVARDRGQDDRLA